MKIRDFDRVIDKLLRATRCMRLADSVYERMVYHRWQRIYQHALTQAYARVYGQATVQTGEQDNG